MYLGDKELSVISYSLQLSVLEYQTAIMRKDFDSADKVMEGTVPITHLYSVAGVPVLMPPTFVPLIYSTDSADRPA